MNVLRCIRQATDELQHGLLISLLQPPPEALELFHDIVVLAEGRVMYHGPMEQVRGKEGSGFFLGGGGVNPKY